VVYASHGSGLNATAERVKVPGPEARLRVVLRPKILRGAVRSRL
jgi:hypothetical protein